MRPLKLFPVWREAWCSATDIPRLLQGAEELLARRSKGNQRFPIVPDTAVERNSIVADAMGRWLQGEPPPPSVRPAGEVAKALYDQAWAVLRPAAWPRWLLLEHAFEDASETGDLHFAALILRTMCEELERLRLLDLDQFQFVEMATSENPDERRSFLEVLACARACLKPLEIDFLDPPKSERGADEPHRDGELEKARSSLNDYIHPNYGSHVAALYPERDTAGRILLNAAVVAYREFFKLSWSEEPLRGASRPVPVQHLSWSRAAREVVSQSLPAAREIMPALAIPQVLDWLTKPSDPAIDFLASPAAAPLVDLLPEALKSWDVAAGPQGQPVAPAALLYLASARRSEALFTEEFPNGAPPVKEIDRWLSFLSRSVELLTLLNAVKEETFKRQLIRQLAQANPLAIDICVRSLIEHRATVTILPGRLARKWVEAARRFQPGAGLPPAIKQMDDAIAKLLAGQRNSAETLMPFAIREDGTPIPPSFSLSSLIGEAFEKGSLHAQAYAFSSATIHARATRGVELLIDRAGKSARRSRLSGLNILDWVCDQRQRKEYLFPALQIVFIAQHAARHIGGGAGQDLKKARQAMGHYEGNLKPGKDYTGDGTRASSIVFREHLLYYVALKRFLDQMNIEPDRLQIASNDRGRWCEIYMGQGREWWFEVSDTLGLLGGSDDTKRI